MTLEEIKGFISENFKDIKSNSVSLDDRGNIEVNLSNEDNDLYIVFDYDEQFEDAHIIVDEYGQSCEISGGYTIYKLWDLMDVLDEDGEPIDISDDYDEIKRIALEKALVCGFDFNEFIHNELN